MEKQWLDHGQGRGRGRGRRSTGAGRGQEAAGTQQTAQEWPQLQQPPQTQPQQSQCSQLQPVQAQQQWYTQSPQLTPTQESPPRQSQPPAKQEDVSGPLQNLSNADNAPPMVTYRHHKSKVQPPEIQAIMETPYPNKRAPNEQRPKQKITLETNYLPITFGKLKEAIHYDVVIENEKKSDRLPKKMLPFIMQQYIDEYFPKNYPAYDGVKNLYSATPLTPSGYHEAVIEFEDENATISKFTVRVKFAAKVDLTAIERYYNTTSVQTDNSLSSALTCIDIVFKHAAQLRFAKVGRSFFSPPLKPVHLGGGYEMWNGIYSSAILGWKPYLNVDITHKGFMKSQNIVDLIYELGGSKEEVNNGLPPYLLTKLKDFLQGIKVDFRIPDQLNSKRSYTVNDIMDTPGNITFPFNNRKMSVLEYFKTEKRYSIKYPHLPCLWVGSKAKSIKICLPVELCTIVSKQTKRTETPSLISALIKESATPADIRKQKILEAYQKMNYTSDETIAAFGLNIGSKFINIEGSIFPPPVLEYGQNSTLKPNNGVWYGQKFFNPTSLSKWGILCMDNVGPGEIQFCIEKLVEAGRKAGMVIERPYFKQCVFKAQDLKNELQQAAKDNVQLLMIVINPNRDHYSLVKQEAEIKYGVLTQCIKKRTFCMMNTNTAQMILLKINAKLNGTNHKIFKTSKPNCLRTPCMVMGADVTHPPPFSREPSIAAISASFDVNAFKYNIQWRIQPPKTEYILDLKAVTEIHLRNFQKKLNRFPVKIVMFRDGVGETMFEEIRHQELLAMRAACHSIDPAYEPKITFIVVQKGHHTRFFSSEDSMTDKNKNVPAGTCVDSEITSKRNTDFYLLSHSSIKGTARPTRYQMLWDDSDMTDVEVEELSYYLCHLFSRCNRAVSYPVPTYYSHLGAERAKSLIKGKFIDYSNLHGEQIKLKVMEKLQDNNPMFFV